ncbi:hypothetical protein TNCT_327921 [Trichonephila clavata]|uniref:Uncharacterized protein n=1 Tax=Trichonephila clavata TaxID=2740835 RepID=A0A8X6GTI0_TRICU|nr:hypothetical protein TNCT_327921 [Trichonephila clavata]
MASVTDTFRKYLLLKSLLPDNTMNPKSKSKEDMAMLTLEAFQLFKNICNGSNGVRLITQRTAQTAYQTIFISFMNEESQENQSFRSDAKLQNNFQIRLISLQKRSLKRECLNLSVDCIDG